MKKNFTIRLSEQRLEKLKRAATERDKTMTAMIEDWIDRLQLQKTNGE